MLNSTGSGDGLLADDERQKQRKAELEGAAVAAERAVVIAVDREGGHGCGSSSPDRQR